MTDCGMTVGARQASLSVSETADLQGFSHLIVSMIHSELCEKHKTSSERTDILF